MNAIFQHVMQVGTAHAGRRLNAHSDDAPRLRTTSGHTQAVNSDADLSPNSDGTAPLSGFLGPE
jgi:hypothetical protein